MSDYRLPAPAGLLIDRHKPIFFTFEGRRYQGFAGDTLASALAANGVYLLSRSFKYHRPRGPLTMAGLDANTYVQVGTEPNVLADRLALYEGLAASPQNVNGSLRKDRDAWIEKIARFLPVGFYYKAFYKPRGIWNHWEKLIRAKAGLGRIDLDSRHGYHDKAYGFADVAVIGGGPAGLCAALEAASSGVEVMVIEDQPRLGGSLNYARLGVAADHGIALARDLVAQITAQKNITVLNDATCSGWFADNWLAVIKGSRLVKLRARQVVAAMGAVEQPLVFRNNDLPGVMLGSAVQRLIRLYGVKPGRRAVVATANTHGYGAALDLIEAGVEVAAVVDLRETASNSPEAEAVEAKGIRILRGYTVVEALYDVGSGRVKAAGIARIVGWGQTAGQGEKIHCDLIATSVGYAPLAQLLCHTGGRLSYDEQHATLVVDQLPKAAGIAGSLAGTWNLHAALAEGRLAGWQAARNAGFAIGEEPPPLTDRGASGINHPWPIFPHPKGKDFVDFDEDQTVGDLINAVADGFEDIELLKRYTTVGMGPSQGRCSALNALRIGCGLSGRGVAGLTVTTQRPPFRPESFAHLAGRSFEPERLTAMHHRHRELGAQLMVAGAWWRPAYYGQDRDQAIRREALSVRENVGLIDVSTLGKLEVRGPDAGELLNRLYTYAYAKQPAGRARYLLLTDETGAIADDGVACRLDAQRFYVTATTGGVDGVYRAMLRWNAQWRLAVDIANVTAAYAAVNIAGPNARNVLAKLATDLDLSAQGFPYMGVREGAFAGIPVRVLRVGFVGELGYEIHVPAGCGEALWDLLMEAGAAFGIRPFGVEAQRLLRLEKGHIIVGQDTDGLTTPEEADMVWAIARKKPFFIGKRALEIQAKRPLARKLVGFTLPEDAPLPQECHLVIRAGDIVGRVTSVALSPACRCIIGMAYVHPDDAEPGRSFQIKLGDGRLLKTTVVSLPFYDSDNKRQEL